MDPFGPLIFFGVDERPHYHRCTNNACRHIWRHRADPRWSEEEHTEAHSCPECGTGPVYNKCSPTGEVYA